MKKLGFIVIPLMTISVLVNCSSKAKTYHVKFTNGNKLVEEKNYKENEVIIAPEDPEPYEKDHKTYTFEGWYDGDTKFEAGTKATKDVEYVAKFNSVDITYTVIFKDKGEDVKTVTGKFGDTIEAPSDPEGYDDTTDYYHYNFNGWYDGKDKFEQNVTTITGNQTFISNYVKGEPVTYTATFRDEGEDKKVEFTVLDTIKETPSMTHTASTGHTAFWLIGNEKVLPNTNFDFKNYLGTKSTFSYDDIANPHTITLIVNGKEDEVIDSAFGEKILSKDVPQTEDSYDKIEGGDYYYHYFAGKWTYTQGGTDYVQSTDTLGDTDIKIYAKFVKKETDPIIYTATFHDEEEDKKVEFTVIDTIKATPNMTHIASDDHTAFWLIGDEKVRPNTEYDFKDYLGTKSEFNYQDIINPRITLWLGDDKYDRIGRIYGEKVLQDDIPQTEDGIYAIEGDDHYYYHFTGNWTYTQGGTDYVQSTDTIADKDMNIFAEYKKDENDPIKYTVSFFDTDEETVIATKEIYCPDTLSITAPEISKEPEEGYEWRWVKDTYSFVSNASIEFGDDKPKLPINDYNFVLQHIALTYNINYELGDDAAFNPDANPKTYQLSDEITLLEPSLAGFTFNGWYLAPNEAKPLGGDGWKPGRMIGDITLYADWHVEGETLADYSWTAINNISEDKEASKYFDIGEETTVAFNNYTYTVRIIGFNHDALVSPGATNAGITFEFANVITQNNESKRIAWDINASPDYDSTNYNFIGSNLNSFLTNVYDNMLPNELKGVIKNVIKYVAHTTNYKATEYPTKLFPLACDEITSDTIDWANHDEGNTYQYYINHPEKEYRKKKAAGNDSYAITYWLRSPTIDWKYSASHVYYDGKISATLVSNEYAVAPAFCI